LYSVILLLTIWLLLPCASLSALEPRNLVENPSFEESDEMGDPAHWDWWGSEAGQLTDGEVFEWEPEGHSGERSVSIREECWGSRGYWHTILRGIEPGRWYAVSVWARRDRPTGWMPELHLFGQRKVMNLYRAGVWRKFNWLLNSGEFSGDVVLKLVNWRKPYRVWFDDVVVEEFCVEVEAEAEPGELRWRYPRTGCLVVFTVEGARDEQFRDGVFTQAMTLKNEIRLPANILPGEWHWRVKAFQNDVPLAMSQPRKVEIEPPDRTRGPFVPHQEAIPSLQRESSEYISFDQDLNLLVDGKPFFPIGIYGLPVEKFSEAKRAGFNTVWTDEVEAARRAGLRTIVSRGFQYPGKGRTATISEDEANRWIIARYLWDEPAQTNASPREVFEAHVAEKRADPYHPTAIVVYRPENFPPYASASDILMTDPYPIPHRPLSVVSESVRAAREAVRDQKPVWAIIQAFNWMDVSQEAQRIGWARWPTYAEERCMVYLAVINGAKGMLFYRYGGHGKHDPNNWRALKRVAAELKELSPILLSRTLPQPVSVAVHRPGQTDESDENKRIEYTLKSHGHRTYLIAANNWPGKRHVTFSFEKQLRGSVSMPLEKRKIKAESRSFSDVFEPYGVHIYELSFR